MPHVPLVAPKEHVGGRQSIGAGVIVVNRQPKLLQVVGALCASRRLSSRLDGGEKQGNQNRDDGNDHQKFDQSEALARNSLCPHS